MKLNCVVPKEVPLILGVLSLITLGSGLCAHAQTTGEFPSPVMKAALPREKQTTLGLYVTAKEAYEKWQAAPEKTKILDVRTTEEHLFVGHPEMAWNIPVSVQTHEWDASRQHLVMQPNPNFISQVKEVFAPGDTLLVMCRSGGRSAMAVDQLTEAGFTSVYNIIDGMEGDKVEDPASIFHGKRMQNGWKNSGLPWTYQLTPERIRLP